MKRAFSLILVLVMLMSMLETASGEGETGTENPAEVSATAELTAEPAEEPADEPTAEPAEEPADEPTAEPAEESVDEPTTEPTEEPVDEPTAEPAEEPADEPTAEPAEEPADEPTAEPAEEPADEPTAEPAEEPADEPTTEPTEEPADEPTAEPVEEPADEPTAEPVEEPADEPTAEPVEEPADEPTAEPVEEPADEPTAEPVEEPADEPTAEPTEEATDEPTAEPTEEATDEPTEEATDEPTAEPVEEPADEPTAAPTEEPADEPTAEPTEEATDEPTAEPTEEPADEPTPVECEHEWENTGYTQQATCLREGVYEQTCTKCGECNFVPTGKLTDHEPPEAVPFEDCTGKGTEQKCTICNDYSRNYTESYDPPEHEFTEHRGRIATCLRQGYEESYCSKCKEWLRTKDIPKLTDHEPTETVDFEDCWGKGTEQKCAICNDSNRFYTESYDEPRHEWENTGFTRRATCLCEGGYRQECAKCFESQFVVTAEKLTDHEPPEAVPFEDCWGKGTEQKCTICDYFDRNYTESYDPPKHEFTDERTNKATCMWAGSIDKYCSKCEQWNWIEDIPKLTDHEPPEVVPFEECRGKGTVQTCTICNDSNKIYTERYDPPKHEWENTGYTRQATCLREGGYEKQCTKCGNCEFVVTADKLTDHEPPEAVPFEDCWGKGTEQKCAICNDRSRFYTASYEEPRHEWEDREPSQPTCMWEGEEHQQCKVCGQWNVIRKIPRLTDHEPPIAVPFEDCEGKGTEQSCDICNVGRHRNYTEHYDPPRHEFFDERTDKATCLREGGISKRCSKCKDWYRVETIPKLTDHEPSEAVPFENCIGMGTMQRCDICNDNIEYYTERFNPPKHDWENTDHTRQATCVREGGYEQQCTKCGEYRFVGTGKLTDHEPPEAVPFEDCTGKGTEQKCTICNDNSRNYTEHYEPPKHEWENTDYTQQATCVREGGYEQQCTKCGEYQFVGTGKLTDHEPPEAQPFEDCEGKGTEQKCTICNDSSKNYTERYNPPRHEFTDERIYKSTCMWEGGIDKYCSKCKDWYWIESIPKLTDHEPPEAVPFEDCRGKGTEQTCAICNESNKNYTERYDPPKHEWENTGYSRQATCLREGGYQQKCTKCGEYRTVVTAEKLTDHEPPEAQPFEDCDGKGTEQKCTICNDSSKNYTERYNPPRHEFTDERIYKSTCMWEGSIDKYCSKCEKWIWNEDIPKLTDHEPPEVVPFEDCEGKGTMQTCTICNEGNKNYTERYDPPKHEWKYIGGNQQATCVNEGGYQERCAKCGFYQFVGTGKLTDHEPPEAVPFEDCWGKGTEQKCDICNDSSKNYTERYASPKHEFTEEKTFKATCMSEGSIAKYCSKCHEWYSIESIPKLTDHEPEAVPFDDCTGKGTLYTCTICNDGDYISYTECYDPPKHEWENTDYTQQATCLQEGGYGQACTKCGEYQFVVTAGKLTDHEPPEAVPFEDCWGIGTKQKCDICNDDSRFYTESYDEPTHEFTDERTNKATCMWEGSIDKYCIKCGKWIWIEDIPKLTDHEPPEAVPFDDCWGKGTEQTCTICNEGNKNYTERYDPPKHEFTEHRGRIATCLRQGYEEGYCSKCEEWLRIKDVPKLTDHEQPETVPFEECWGKGTEQKCTICNDSNKTYTERYDTPKHEWRDNGIFESASCLDEGGYGQICTRCKDYQFVVTEEKRTDHEPPEAVPYEDCWLKGTQQRCNICNDTVENITEFFNPPKHEWENTGHTQQATCLHEGGYEQMCTKCGARQTVVTEGKRTDHEPPEAVPYDGCTFKGTEQKCVICNDKIVAFIELYDSPKHELSDYSMTGEPTCMRASSVMKYCSKCDSWILIESRPVRTDHARPQPVPYVDCYGEGVDYWCDICQSHWVEYQKWYSEPKHEFTETKPGAANCMWQGGVSKYCSKGDHWIIVDPLPVRVDHEPPKYSPFEDCYGKGVKRYCEICEEGDELYEVKYDPPKHDFVLVGDEYICSHCDERKEIPPESDVTPEPTAEPTPVPTAEPTAEPTPVPTAEPTAEPTLVPPVEPTADPTTVPTVEPTAEPTLVPPVEPTADPTTVPTAEPTAEPTAVPTAEPTAEPTPVPTAKPTAKPTPVPTAEPTAEPTATPEPIVEAVQDIVNSSFEEQEDEMSAKPEVVVEKDDTGAVSVTIITPSSVADDTSTEIGEQDSSAESDAKEPQSVNLTAEVITSLSENAVSNVVLQDAESNTQVQMKDMAAVIEEIKTENAESIVVEFDKTAAITAMEKNHEAVKDYEVTNVCNIAVKLISGGEEKTISNNVKGLTVRWNGLKTEADQVILFISADGTIIELEAVWVEGENGADSYWEIPYAGAGTYVLANHIEASK